MVTNSEKLQSTNYLAGLVLPEVLTLVTVGCFMESICFFMLRVGGVTLKYSYITKICEEQA
jgi:hypothetical protein